MFSSILLLCAILITHANSHSPVVNITSGLIEGLHVHSKVTNKTFFSFRGIPYAEPPIGELRFMPPVKPKPWTNTLETKADGSACKQKGGGSENCLFLNVFTPSLPSDEEKSELLPVIFYIHGGSYIAGASDSKYMGPDFLVDKNIILVAMNYRLNVFGFLNAMEESAPGNVGLKDLVAALEWVQENIEQFNGDPNRVTIAGCSAGSGLVQYLLQSNLTEGLFHGAIMQSGSSINVWSIEPNPVDMVHKLGVVLDVDSGNVTDVVEKLKQIPTDELFQASISPFILIEKYTMTRQKFVPSLETDSPTSIASENSITVLSKNKINSVPLMMGYSSNEMLFVIGDIKSGKLSLEEHEQNPNLLIPETLNINTDSESAIAVRNKIRKHYFNNKPITNVTEFLYFKSDDTFVNGIRKSLELLRPHNDIYFYVYGYKHKNDFPEYPGASHVAELRFMFYTGGEESTEDKIMREKITTLWANFVKTGNPTPDVDPLLDNITWPLVSRNPEDKVKYLKIEKQLEIGENLNDTNYKFWEQIYKKHGQGTQLAY